MNNIFIGFFFGFLLFVIFHYIPVKQHNIKMELELLIKKRCFHIHHWITVLFMIILVYIGRYCSITIFEFLLGFLLGILLEDFLFRNVFNLHNCNRR